MGVYKEVHQELGLKKINPNPFRVERLKDGDVVLVIDDESDDFRPSRA